MSKTIEWGSLIVLGCKRLPTRLYLNVQEDNMTTTEQQTNEELQIRVDQLTKELNQYKSKLLISHFLSRYGNSVSVRMKNVIELLDQLGFSTK